jgi:hypothetical protein
MPVSPSFDIIRGGVGPVFVDNDETEMVVDRRETGESRPDLLDFEGTRERRAHANFCSQASGTAPSGESSEGCGGTGFNFSSSSSSSQQYLAMHAIHSRELVFVDDILSQFDWQNVPDKAAWYIHSIEYGHALDIVAWKADSSSLFGLGASFGEDADRAAFNFRNKSQENGYTVSALMRGFVAKEDSCLFPGDAEEFESCWAPSGEPIPIMMTLRNIPQTCLPEDKRIERDWPVEMTVRFDEIEVLSSGEDDATWSIEPHCQVEGVDLQLRVEAKSFALDAVSPGSYTPPGKSNPITIAGVVPGQTIRCGMGGREITPTQGGSPLPYEEFEMDVPSFDDAEEIVEGTFEQSDLEGPSYRVHYTLEFRQLN